MPSVTVMVSSSEASLPFNFEYQIAETKQKETRTAIKREMLQKQSFGDTTPAFLERYSQHHRSAVTISANSFYSAVAQFKGFATFWLR